MINAILSHQHMPDRSVFVFQFVLYGCVGEWQQWTELSPMCRCTVYLCIWMLSMLFHKVVIWPFKSNFRDTCLSGLCPAYQHSGLSGFNCESLQNIKKLHYMKKKTVVSSHHILSTKRNLLCSLFTLWLIRLDLQHTQNEALNNTKWLPWKPLYLLPTTSTTRGFRSRSVVKRFAAWICWSQDDCCVLHTIAAKSS